MEGACILLCNSDRLGKSDEERVEQLMKRVEADDAVAIYVLANDYHHGNGSLQQDRAKAMKLFARAAEHLS